MTIAGGLLRGGDGITISNIPAGLDIYAGYTSGAYPTYAPLVAEYPHALHLAYSINEYTWGDCLDVEPGDASPNQTDYWMDHSWRSVNTPKPALYTNASSAGPMVLDTSHARAEYLLLVAHYTNVPHICSSAACWPSSPIAWVADGSQWSDNGGLWDSLLFNEYFFIASPPPPPPPPPPKGINIMTSVINPAGQLVIAGTATDNGDLLVFTLVNGKWSVIDVTDQIGITPRAYKIT